MVLIGLQSSLTDGKKTAKDSERRMSEETTTATDILSQIINESLRAPSSMVCLTIVLDRFTKLEDLMESRNYVRSSVMYLGL